MIDGAMAKGQWRSEWPGVHRQLRPSICLMVLLALLKTAD
jgi:hypothetical protein